MSRLFLSFFLLVGFGSSALAVEECSEESKAVLLDWMTKNPGDVGMLELYRVLSVGNEESRYVSKKAQNDKVRHCFVGCRIAYEVSLRAAIFAGWYKEHRDLTDCDPATHFDPSDEVATRKGAGLGAELRKTDPPGSQPKATNVEKSRLGCLRACRSNAGN